MPAKDAGKSTAALVVLCSLVLTLNEIQLLFFVYLGTVFVVLALANRWLRKRNPGGIVLDFDPSQPILHQDEEETP